MALERTEVPLDPAHYQAVTDLARSQQRPVADVIRELIDIGLERLQRDRERRLKALDELDAARRALEAQIGVSGGQPVAEVRAERERQTDEVLLSGQTR